MVRLHPQLRIHELRSSFSSRHHTLRHGFSGSSLAPFLFCFVWRSRSRSIWRQTQRGERGAAGRSIHPSIIIMEVVMGRRPKNLRVVGRNQALPHPYSHPRARAQGGPKQRLSRRRTPCRMLGVVVTGSTKGVGLALAREFLKTGDDSVVICSRNQEQVDKAVKLLLQENPNLSSQGRNRVGGVACDVSKAKDVVNLRVRKRVLRTCGHLGQQRRHERVPVQALDRDGV